MNKKARGMKVHLVLTETGLEKVQVYSDRQREAIELSARLTDIIDDFEKRFLERVSEWRSEDGQS